MNLSKRVLLLMFIFSLNLFTACATQDKYWNNGIVNKNPDGDGKSNQFDEVKNQFAGVRKFNKDKF